VPEASPATTSNERTTLPAIAALLNDVFHLGRFEGPSYLEWLYRQNPDGNEIATDLFDGPRCLAHYCVVPVRYGATPMALSLNTAVSPDARMKGLFVRLAEETFTRAAAQGIAGITGVANANSTHGFVHRLGFRLVTELPVRIGLSARGSRGYDTFSPDRLSDSEIERRIGALPAGRSPGNAPEWSMQKLIWRLRSPACRYLVHVGRDVIAVSTLERRHGVPFAVIVKTFTRAEGADARALLGAVCRAHGTVFYVHCGVTDGLAIPGLPLPSALRPVPLNFIYRPLLPAAPSREAFRLGPFEFLDFDAY
jgi:GNAT superfamily N-acetyltransferase